MGAFGELLQAYFGGTVHDVKTWNNIPNNKNLPLCEKCRERVKEVTYIPPLKRNLCHTCIINHPDLSDDWKI